jgi:Tat protein secretion system quality control protein TatD with DNase activity
MSWWDRQLSDAQELLARAAIQGVTPPDFAATFSTARHLSPDFPCDLHFIAGVHPYGARIFLEDAAARERLDVLLNDPRCVGIGEIGLDLGPYNVLPADVQERRFAFSCAWRMSVIYPLSCIYVMVKMIHTPMIWLFAFCRKKAVLRLVVICTAIPATLM